MKIETNIYRGFTVKYQRPTKYTRAGIEICDHFFNETISIVYDHVDGCYVGQAVQKLKEIGFNVIGVTKLKNDEVDTVIFCDWSMNTEK